VDAFLKTPLDFPHEKTPTPRKVEPGVLASLIEEERDPSPVI
jgi:hypothetical protein